MSPRNGIISNRFYFTLVGLILITPSEGFVRSHNCPGSPQYVKSSKRYTEIDIVTRARSNPSNCTWIIERDDCNGVGVEVDVQGLARRNDYSLHINIYDGLSSMYPTIATYVKHRYSNSERSFGPRRSSGRFLTIVFTVRGDHYSQRNFQFRYRNTPKGLLPSDTENGKIENSVSDTCGDEFLIAYQTPNVVTSPGYPREYGNSLDCKWTIKSDDICNDDVIHVTIHSFSLEETYDHLVIYNGDTAFDPVLIKLSGNVEPQLITSSGTSIVIEFKTDDTASGRGFHLSYTRMRPTPTLSESVAIKMTERSADLSVDFTSSTPHRKVYWSRNDVIIHQDEKHIFTVTPAKVRMEPETDVTVEGFTAKLIITNPDSQDIGMYKIAVVNEFGVGERTVNLRRNSVPVVQNYAVFPENASITVTFAAYPNFKAEWYKTQRILASGSDVHITTEFVENYENGNDDMAIYKSVLSPAFPTENDYGEYRFIIRNDLGTSEIYIHMDFPASELPKILATPSPVKLSNRNLTLSVNFDSNIAYPTIKWYHGGNRLEKSSKYRPYAKWQGISAQDWSTNGYPVAVTLTEFKRISTTHQGHTNNSSNSNGYDCPTIGGDRSSTQPASSYVAMLTISDVTPEDFGVYRVVVENGAGISRHVIDVIAPEVFPHVTCNQADTIRLTCNVTACSSSNQSWIHSYDGETVRYLPGHQDGSINTLTIPLCMHSDAGTYTCVATEKETGNDVAIQHDKTTLTVRAVPVILESTVDIMRNTLHIEVPFFSYPPHHRITWYRNRDQISSSSKITMVTKSRDVVLPMHGKTCRQAGHVTSITLSSLDGRDFGIYKITVSNEMGISEHIIEVQNPEYANPVSSNHVSVSHDGGSAILRVVFFSYYNKFSVDWSFNGKEVRENHPVNKYEIETGSSTFSYSDDTVVRIMREQSTTLTVTCVSDEDYGRYDVVVSNKAGKAVIPVWLAKPDQGVPEIVGDIVTDVKNSTGEINATFLSSPSYTFIRWLKEGKEIENDSSKYRILNENIDIDVPSDGETMAKIGTITRLSVTSLEDKDYGRYTVQIFNKVGMTDRSVKLDEVCTL
ncbi:titin-like [Ylistrum balloti]|uniref:titin-like n=1 Tax=Ylistrum balloti TaxID=509963 RepID=UPI002905C6E7|nr:titin-like [Ylistrum balloti]